MTDEEFNEWFLSASNSEKIEKVEKFIDAARMNRKQFNFTDEEIIGFEVRLNEFEKMHKEAEEARRKLIIARQRFIQSANALEETMLREIKTESLRYLWGNILRDFRLTSKL